MTHHLRIVAVVVVLTALALCVPVQAQTPELDALRARSEQGDADAQFILGVMYDNGRGVAQNDAKAVRWFRLAAEQGLAEAQFSLGLMYATGTGVPQDDAETVHWYQLAAEQGQVDAQGNLGFMYANGRGVPQDDVQAHMWYNLAALRVAGEEREVAVEARDLAADRMTPEDRSEAQRLAREWDAAHPREP
jgi:hypothetical protein